MRIILSILGLLTFAIAFVIGVLTVLTIDVVTHEINMWLIIPVAFVGAVGIAIVRNLNVFLRS